MLIEEVVLEGLQHRHSQGYELQELQVAQGYPARNIKLTSKETEPIQGVAGKTAACFLLKTNTLTNLFF